MRRLLIGLLRIGADPADDEDLRLRKVILLAAILMIAPAAALWGAIYWVFGEPVAAAIPWTYLILSVVGTALFSLTRSYSVLAVTQFVSYTLLPFALMWVLGGFVSSSAVGLWAWLGPLSARIVGHRRASAALFVAFAAGFVLTAFLQSALVSRNHLPELVVVGFFVLNVVAVGAITLILVDASAGGREGSLASMRGIVKRYFSPAVVEILADPRRQELGGEVADVTILFADLGGYTTYAESRKPREVVELLNTVFSAAMPAIVAEGGTPVQIPGDAVMAVFGAPRPQADHASHAARAALAIQARGQELAKQHPTWPRFRIGLNSGETLVGNIGGDEFRSFTAIGDTTNMAARFQSLADPGQIVIGPRTAELLGGRAEMTSLGEVTVKGKADPIAPWSLLAVREG